MSWIRNVSIKRKLTLVILLASISLLLLTCAALATNEVLAFRSSLVHDLTVLADLLGRNSAAALTFDDDKAANATLATLAAEPHIISACLYGKDGKRFAQYQREASANQFPADPPPDGHEFAHNSVALTHTILVDSKPAGAIYVRADLEGMYDRLKSYAVIVAVVVVLAIIIAFVLSFTLQGFITKPILALADLARIVGERKDYSVRAKKHGGDEIGLLIDAVNQMLTEIETGQSALQQANRSLQAQAGQIAETVGILGASAKELLSLGTKVAASAAATASAVAQTSTIVQEVRQTAQVSSEKTRRVSEAAQRVAQTSEQGKKSTVETVAGMSHIRQQMHSIADSMARLIDQSQAIGQIVATVEDLSAQSNILAVNASIEAAKAGEQGRGFAVVAQEVRSLAEQSKQATNQVRNILGDIRKATSSAVMATEQGSKAVEAGVQQAGDAGQSIQTLANSVNEAAQAATQIAASSQQQLVGVDQVASAMESIKEASTQNAGSAKDLEASAHLLGELGQKLKQAVEKYKV